MALGAEGGGRLSCALIASGMHITSVPWGALPDGEAIELYTLANDRGLAVRIATYGGTLVSIHAPDRDGVMADILLGFDALDGYVRPHPYFGGTIGRYANRIARGRFELDGVEYRLACNDHGQHLHGGVTGFDRRTWRARVATHGAAPVLELRYASRDGEEGYPGALEACVTYALDEDSALAIEYRATCDRPTIVNLTHHAYFNLAAGGDVLDHRYTLPGRRFLPVDESLIPTGELRPVRDTVMDFTAPSTLRARMAADDPQLRAAGGYDHTWVLERSSDPLAPAAQVHEPRSGRTLAIHTTQPGVQFYSGNLLDGSVIGKSGRRYDRHAGFCLETQHFPDSPNQPSFPATVLEPGATYEERTVYRFGIAQR